MELTVERLREVLDYDPATGVFRWKVGRGKVMPGSIAGSLHSTGYWFIGIDYRAYKAHRLAWLYVYGEWPLGNLDHTDNVPSHNWLANLRPADQTQNNANKRRAKSNTSGFKGVSFHKKTGKWRSDIKRNGQSIFLGLYDDPKDAQVAYIAKAQELFGKFARSA